MSELFADVIIEITSEKLDRSFQYRIPPALAEEVSEGVRVKIPFGNGSRMINGYVISVSDRPVLEPERMKDIVSVEQESMTVEDDLIALAAWMRKTYGSTMIQALKTVLPVRERKRVRQEKKLYLKIEKEVGETLLLEYTRKHFKAKARLLETILRDGAISGNQKLRDLKIPADTVRSLIRDNIIGEEHLVSYRNPFSAEALEMNAVHEAEISLNPEQREVYHGICREWQGEKRPCLIEGITGSGKTAVYMKLIDDMLSADRQVIVLIPEIALTWQTVSRFIRQFGDQVTVLHSRMTPAQRSDQFDRVKNGEVNIVIGPRSALFTPFDHLGLIIIDEEQEQSYRSEVTPRYHARETAIKRAELCDARVVLGSATPSVDAMYEAEQGRYAHYQIKNRYGGAKLPEVSVVDMREELRAGNRSIISRRLMQGIGERLAKKEQTILFLNRRGYTGFISCRSCGEVIRCPHCDVSLTLHQNQKLICHYCGYEIPNLRECPSCGSPYIGGFRAGTEQVEQYIKKQFPAASILRMDADTTKNKDGYEKILRKFAQGEADILVGTQMIVKGHDFPGVTLVGVVAADVSLNASDYRAAERTCQLLMQAAGRAGRSGLGGEALIQTYHPEHYSICSAAGQDYGSFYRKEIQMRSLMGYPPVNNLLAVHGSCADEELLMTAMGYIRKYMLRVLKGSLQIIGPAPEAVSKVQDMYRQVIYVKGKTASDLIRMRRLLERYIEMNSGFAEVYIQYDLNI